MVIKLPVQRTVQRPVHHHHQPGSGLYFVNIPFVPVINRAFVTLHQYYSTYSITV